jgi:hypothetical protein
VMSLGGHAWGVARRHAMAGKLFNAETVDLLAHKLTGFVRRDRVVDPNLSRLSLQPFF